MLPNFSIWFPGIFNRASTQLEFMLSPGEIFYINEQEFDTQLIANLLMDIDITLPIKSWSVLPIRTAYLSDFLDSNNWEDIWQLSWKVSVLLEESADLSHLVDDFCYESDAVPSQRFPKIDVIANCYVIADFQDYAAMEQAKARLAELSLRFPSNEKGLLRPPLFSQSKIMKNNYYHLQINLGKFEDKFFADGAAYAWEVMDICKKYGGTVDVDDFFIPFF